MIPEEYIGIINKLVRCQVSQDDNKRLEAFLIEHPELKEEYKKYFIC